MPRSLLALIVMLAIAGCADTKGPPQARAGDSAQRILTASDLERFLNCVRAHSEAIIPDFSPLEDEPSLDPEVPARNLVATFREQVAQLFDVERQGAIWQRDPDWSQALTDAGISGTRFAALVRDVGLAVMRVRLDARVDVNKLVAQARRQVDETVRTIDEIDRLPKAARSLEAVALRTRSAIHLGRSVALLEFAELVKNVPPESAVVVRRYSRQLKPLLPASINEELLVELQSLANDRTGEIEPASYEEPDEE
jgi:hypothetical protein